MAGPGEVNAVFIVARVLGVDGSAVMRMLAAPEVVVVIWVPYPDPKVV